MKGVHSFLGHAGFYRQFIRDFSKVSKPLVSLLKQRVPFEFDDAYMNAFESLKKKLTSAPIISAPDWELLFELIYDASDYAVGAVLGQRKNKIFYAIYYASRTLNYSEVCAGK